MLYMFTVSPDFSPHSLAGWYIFNTWIQNQTQLNIRLNLYTSFKDQQASIHHNENDLVYVNPFDAVRLVRDKGFLPLARVSNRLDEAIIAVKADSMVNHLNDLTPQLKLAMTENPDVNMISMMLLEAMDLNDTNIEKKMYDNYILVVKHLLNGQADVGIFLADAYNSLSSMVKKQLKIILQSDIGELYHSFLIGPTLADKREEIQSLLINMNQNSVGQGVLDALGFTSWIKVQEDEMDFMIDLIDTLSMHNDK